MEERTSACWVLASSSWAEELEVLEELEELVLALEEGFGLHLEISEFSREQMATPAKIARTIGGMLS